MKLQFVLGQKAFVKSVNEAKENVICFQELFRKDFIPLWEDLDKEISKEEPNWISITLLQLMKDGISFLRDKGGKKLEGSSVSGAWAGGEYPIYQEWGEKWPFTFGVTEEALQAYQDQRDELKETFLKYRKLSIINFFTKQIYGEENRGHEFIDPILSGQDQRTADSLSEKEASYFWNEVTSPLTISPYQGEDESVLYPIQGPKFKGEVQNEPFEGHLIFLFYPLMIREPNKYDTPNRKKGHYFIDLHGVEYYAFYPITAGLAFTSLPPYHKDLLVMNKEVYQLLWEGLLLGIDRTIQALSVQEPEEKIEEIKRSIRVEAEKPTFSSSFGNTLIDSNTLNVISKMDTVRFPAKKLSSYPQLEELKEERVQSILEEYGEDAYKDLSIKDPNARGPLLKRVGREEKTLTAEAERDLRREKGRWPGYRDTDDTGKEYLYRLFPVGPDDAFLEVGLTWGGTAAPWVEEWRQKLQELQEQTKILLEESSQLILPFEEQPTERQEKIDRFVRQAQIYEDGQKAMLSIITQMGKQGRNPVELSSEHFKELLSIHNDRNWKAKVKNILQSLRACEFNIRTYNMSRLEGYGSFLSDWFYVGGGPGGHGEGIYYLYVGRPFLGCLYLFTSDVRKLPSGLEATFFDFQKKLTKEDREEWGWGYDTKRDGKTVTYEKRPTRSSYTTIDAGGEFYRDRMLDTNEQKKLDRYLEGQLTLNRDPISRVNNAIKIKAGPESSEPRLYNNGFCPLLPEEKSFHGILGHFRRHPEVGYTLFGTRSPSTDTGGPKTGGLLSVMGYTLPPGRAYKKRRSIKENALNDIVKVIVEYRGGIIVARGPNREWLSMEEAVELPEKVLGHRVKWFFFLPPTWKEDIEKKWEDLSGYKITKDPREAERVRHELAAHSTNTKEPIDALKIGRVSVSLREALEKTRKDRNLSQEAVGEIFGVKKMIVSKWERGEKPISRELVPFIQEWIVTGKEPTPEELASRKTRQAGVRTPPPL